MRKTVLRIIEELFPFGHYFVCYERLKREVKSPNILKDKGMENYCSLSRKQLKKRLKEEHRRPLIIDQKTFRLIISLSFEFTVLSSTAALLREAELREAVETALTIIILTGLVYTLLAGFIALGAMRTFSLYGYGTEFLLQQQSNGQRRILAEALVRQQIMNTLRHLRNETVYMALRNVFVLVLAGAIIFTTTLLWN